MRNMKIFFMAMMGCLVWSVGFAQPSTAIYDEEKTAISVTADKPIITIQLTSNPTTGYTWFLSSYNDKLLLPLKHSYQAPNTKLIGASGTEIWTFRVKPEAFVVPHQTTIQFINARPWEKEDAGKKLTFTVSCS